MSEPVFMKSGQSWLYNAVGDIVGVKDPDGSEQYFATSPTQLPAGALPVTAVESLNGVLENSGGSSAVSDDAYWRLGSANAQISASKAAIDYDDNAAFTEAWANLTAWTPGGANGVQVSGGALYAGSAYGGGTSGNNHSFAVAAGENMRAVFVVNYASAASSGGIMVGVSDDAAGAAPASAGGNARALYFTGNDVRSWDQGSPTVLTNSVTAGIYVVTVTADQQYLSIVARKSDGSAEYRTRWARAGYTINNLFVFNSDSRQLSGVSVKAVGARKQFGSVAPRTGIEGVGYTAHWSGDGTQNFKLTLPTSYDSRSPVPLAVMFHGNGSDENHFADNGNGVAAGNALLAAGYATLTCTYAANTATWGAQASLDAYKAAYKYFRDRYALGAVVFYGNSMGGLESLLALSDGGIPGVLAWAATHPACSLLSAYNGGFTDAIKPAYGIASDGSDYGTKTAGHDPLLLNQARFRGVPMWFLYATDDTSVPAAENAVLMIPRVTGYAKSVTSQTTTGGHSAAVSAFMASMIAFYDAAIGK